MLKTLAEAQASSLQDIAGVCPTGDKFLRLLNDAVEMLMRRGDWTGTVVPIQVCAQRGCLVWPRYVGMVRKINVCHHPILNQNFWWSFINDAVHNQEGWWGRWCGQSCSLIGGQQSPVFQDIMGDGRYVRAYAQYPADHGKTIKIFGVDNGDQPLRELDSLGAYVEGITLTLGTPFVSTNTPVRRIDRVLKQETQGTVRLFAYNAVDNVLENIAYYEPGDLNPSFTRYSLNLPACHSQSGDANACGQTNSIAAIVKLRFVPVKYPDDLVLIQNIGALRYQLQGLKAQEAGEIGRAREYFASAVNELNRELADNNPEVTIPLSLGELGGASYIGFQKAW